MSKYRKMKSYSISIMCGALLLGTPCYGQDVTIEVNFDEPLADSGTTYYLVTDLDDEIDRTHSGVEAMTIKDKTIYYGMSEEAVNELLEAEDENVVVVFTLGENTSSTEDSKERSIDAVNYHYDENKLVEIEITEALHTSVGDFVGMSPDKVEKILGKERYVNSYDQVLQKGMIVYKNERAYTYLYIENASVKAWGVTTKDYRHIDNWPIKYQSHSIAFENGNSNGNIINGGLITSQDGWSYYSQPTHLGEHLYKMSSDGLERSLLAEDSPRYINVKGEWLYYVNMSDKTLNGEGRVYKIKTDGSQRQRLTSIGAQYLVINNEGVYFSSQGNSDDIVPGLYSISKDGEGLTLLDQGQTSFVNIVYDTLYYLVEKEQSEEKIIRQYAIADQYSSDILTGNIGFLLVDEYRVYFSDVEEGHKAYLLKSDLKTKLLITENPIVSMNAWDGVYLFQSIFNEISVTQYLTVGIPIKESTNQYNNIQMIGHKIFYHQNEGEALTFNQKHLWKNQSKEISEILFDTVQENSVLESIENGKIIGRWGLDVFYFSTDDSKDGLFYMDGESKLVTQLNNIAIKEGLLIGNDLYYIDKRTEYLMCSDYLGKRVEKLKASKVSAINIDGEWLYYKQDEENWKMKLDGSQDQKVISTNIK